MTKITPEIFRAYDIRGIYPEQLNEETAYRIGLAYGNLLKDAKKIAVGRDYRLSSASLKNALVSGLRESGKDVIDIGEAPSPVLFFGIIHYQRDGGLMVTASHNPREYNGVKPFKERSIPLTGETGIYKMREMVLKNDFPKSGSVQEGKLSEAEIVSDYMEYVVGKIKLEKPLKIILDTGNGACGDIPEKIFQKLGAEVITIFKKPDGAFPNHIADPCNTDTLKDLQKKVKEEKADFGLAYDGDGDRVGLVDERGEIISSDFILMMLSRQALEYQKEHNLNSFQREIISEVSASRALMDDIESRGGKFVFSKVGHSYILNKIAERKAVFGGEASGHMYFPYCYYDYDDGIFAGCKIAEIISGLKGGPSEYLTGFPRYINSAPVFIPYPDNQKFQAIERLIKYLDENNYDYLGIDGARVNFPNGWALVRASNTAPDIKARFEADTKENLGKIISEMREILKKVDIKLPEVEI